MKKCDRSEYAVKRQLQNQIELKFNEIRKIFPGIDCIHIFNRETEVFTHPTDNDKSRGKIDKQQLFENVMKLQENISKFGKVMGEDSIPMSHIVACKQMFSCYRCGPEYFIAFYSTIDEKESKYHIDTTEEDNKVKNILDDLEQSLIGVHLISRHGKRLSRSKSVTIEIGDKLKDMKDKDRGTT